MSKPSEYPSSQIFLAASAYGSGGEFTDAVAVADVNGDGIPDLVLVNEFSLDFGEIGTVAVLLGNGNGTFQPAITYSYNGDQAPAVVVADVNDDGKPDILVAAACATLPECETGGVSVLLGVGDGTFQPAVTYIAGQYDTRSLVVADVNEDGKPDVVLTYYCELPKCTRGGVSVLLGNGDGSFQSPVSYDYGGYGTTSIAAGDVNGDGKLDLLIGSCNAPGSCDDGGVSVLFGNGDGSFQPPVIIFSGGQPGFVALADINRDGTLDLIVGEVGIAVLLGRGDGTFKPAVNFGSGGQYVAAVAVADVNGDGKPDLLVGLGCVTLGDCDDGGVAVLLGKGNGTFQAPLVYDSGENESLGVAVGDLDGDGRLDLVAANQCVTTSDCSSGGVSVLLGNGNGTLQGARAFESGSDVVSVALSDVNGDGELDLLAVAGNFKGQVGVLLDKGNGKFGTPVFYGTGGSGPVDAASVAVGDVNGDGKPDLLVANGCFDNGEPSCIYGEGVLGVLLGNGNGTFQPAVSYDTGGAEATSVALADLNGDGKVDVVVANVCSGDCSSGTVSILFGNGDGTFQKAVTYLSGGSTYQFWPAPYALAVADVNGDGRPDLLVINDCVTNCADSSGSVGVLLNNGDGTFQPVVTYSSGGQDAFSLVAGDVNGDGKVDLLVANQCASGVACGNANTPSSGSIGVLLGNGDGTFKPAMAVLTPEQNRGALALADFNGDGKLDVAAGASGVLLLGNGDGTFQPSIPLGAFGADMAVGDLNGDGKPDLVLGGATVLLNVSTIPTTTFLTSSQNPSKEAKCVTFTVRVSSAGGIPAGTVGLMDGTTVLAAKTLSGGRAIFTTSKLQVGSNRITAIYRGNSNFGVSTSTPVYQVVLATTTATLTSTPNPSHYQDKVTFTAVIFSAEGPLPDGETVSFMNGKTLLGTGMLSGGLANFSTSALNVGTTLVTAIYDGDSNFEGSTSKPVKQVVHRSGK